MYTDGASYVAHTIYDQLMSACWYNVRKAKSEVIWIVLYREFMDVFVVVPQNVWRVALCSEIQSVEATHVERMSVAIIQVSIIL